MKEAIGIVSIIKQIRKKSGTQNRELFQIRNLIIKTHQTRLIRCRDRIRGNPGSQFQSSYYIILRVIYRSLTFQYCLPGIEYKPTHHPPSTQAVVSHSEMSWQLLVLFQSRSRSYLLSGPHFSLMTDPEVDTPASFSIFSVSYNWRPRTAARNKKKSFHTFLQFQS